MKKQLLLSIAVVTGGITLAQNTSVVTKPKIDPNKANIALPYSKANLVGASETEIFETYVNKLSQKHYPESTQNRAFSTTTIATAIIKAFNTVSNKVLPVDCPMIFSL